MHKCNPEAQSQHTREAGLRLPSRCTAPALHMRALHTNTTVYTGAGQGTL